MSFATELLAAINFLIENAAHGIDWKAPHEVPRLNCKKWHALWYALGHPLLEVTAIRGEDLRGLDGIQGPIAEAELTVVVYKAEPVVTLTARWATGETWSSDLKFTGELPPLVVKPHAFSKWLTGFLENAGINASTFDGAMAPLGKWGVDVVTLVVHGDRVQTANLTASSVDDEASPVEGLKRFRVTTHDFAVEASYDVATQTVSSIAHGYIDFANASFEFTFDMSDFRAWLVENDAIGGGVENDRVRREAAYEDSVAHADLAASLGQPAEAMLAGLPFQWKAVEMSMALADPFPFSLEAHAHGPYQIGEAFDVEDVTLYVDDEVVDGAPKPTSLVLDALASWAHKDWLSWFELACTLNGAQWDVALRGNRELAFATVENPKFTDYLKAVPATLQREAQVEVDGQQVLVHDEQRGGPFAM